MAESIEVLESDLYQNGRVFQLENGDQVLLRERYAAQGNEGDSTRQVEAEQDIRLFAFSQYQQTTNRPEGWWWLIFDRNGGFNPIFGEAVGEDGVVVDYTAQPVLVPNLLKQKVRL